MDSSSPDYWFSLETPRYILCNNQLQPNYSAEKTFREVYLDTETKVKKMKGSINKN